ncbi:MAG: NAD-dependent epimerase/dehydratase family protein, partial [Asticcacaulis sp.]
FSSTSRLTKGASPEPAEREVVRKLADGEAAIIDFCSRRDVAWTLLRPTLIYDEGRDENVSRIAATIQKLGFFPVCGQAAGKRQPVHARDLARAALQAIPAGAAFNRTYNLSGGETLTYREMVGRISAGMGRKPVILPLPLWAWRVGLTLISLIRPGKTLSHNIHMAERMNVDLWFDHAQASRDFGYAPGPFRPVFPETGPNPAAAS